MKTTTEIITPDKARKLLEGNRDNRVIRDAHVQFLASEMKKGRWTLTHQGICIAANGRLLDGQHRLFAVVFSGISVPMMVTRDADEESYKYMDIAATRKAADRIKLLNAAAANEVCCRLIKAYLGCAVFVSGNRTPSIDDIETCFLQMADAFKLIAETFSAKKYGPLTRATIGAAVVTYMHNDKMKASYFLDSYLTGANLTEKHPALILRNAVLEGRLSSKDARLNYWKAVAAMRAHREGRPLAFLTEATEDLLGNRQIRLAQQLSARSEKGAAKRKARAIA